MTTLTLHVQVIHEGKGYACDKCDFQGRNRRQMKKHIKTKHKEKLSCKKCNNQFLKQSTLATHIQVIHESMRYACEKCDYQTNKKGCLRKHTQSKHESTTIPIQLTHKRFPKLEVKAGAILQNYYLHQSSIYSCESGIRMDNYDKVEAMENDSLIDIS